ncbi:hypothetical protein [Belliella aquatica]|nr:hypothetical protein [Belliella aquatica]MCH7405739.1 hypothetical protein [Belliella aquatica]
MKKKILMSLCFAFFGATFGFATLERIYEECKPVTLSCGFQTIVCADDLEEMLVLIAEAEEVLCGNPD